MRPRTNDDIEDILEAIFDRLDQIMATLADLTAADAALNDEVNAVVALVQTDTELIKNLQGAIGSGNLTADQQATVDALFAQINTQHDTIAAALTGAAPPAPASVPEPVPAPAPEPPPVP